MGLIIIEVVATQLVSKYIIKAEYLYIAKPI